MPSNVRLSINRVGLAIASADRLDAACGSRVGCRGYRRRRSARACYRPHARAGRAGNGRLLSCPGRLGSHHCYGDVGVVRCRRAGLVLCHEAHSSVRPGPDHRLRVTARVGSGRAPRLPAHASPVEASDDRVRPPAALRLARKRDCLGRGSRGGQPSAEPCPRSTRRGTGPRAPRAGHLQSDRRD